MFILQNTTIQREMKRINQRKIYNTIDYEKLLEPYLNKYEILLYCDFVKRSEIGNGEILLIRHDVDHDYLTAKKMADMEYRCGIQATYCLLHSSWYYGRLKGDCYEHSEQLLETAKYLQERNHEINFHNNLVSVALQQNLDPFKLLEQELAFFRQHGINIVGTSTHGDGLCRELNFRNWEMFKECCDGLHGGPRKLSYKTDNGQAEVLLGNTPMSRFGLTYEAYDIARDVYHTDSGSRMRIRKNTRGRRPFGRTNPNLGSVVGILTHPIWWRFE